MILSFSLTRYIKKVKNKIAVRKTRTRSTCLVNWFLEPMVDHGLTINHGFWMVFSTIAALCSKIIYKISFWVRIPCNKIEQFYGHNNFFVQILIEFFFIEVSNIFNMGTFGKLQFSRRKQVVWIYGRYFEIDFSLKFSAHKNHILIEILFQNAKTDK